MHQQVSIKQSLKQSTPILYCDRSMSHSLLFNQIERYKSSKKCYAISGYNFIRSIGKKTQLY